MKMQVRWFVTGAIVSAAVGVLLGVAAFQPGLEPPAGPVTDTSPSLADLAAAISEIETSITGVPGEILTESASPGDSSVFALTSAPPTVRLHSVILTDGAISFSDADGSVSQFLRAPFSFNGNNDTRNTVQILFGGLEVDTPLQVNSSDNGIEERVQFLYWVD
ncbi:MAG: hypothetical protein AAFR76_06080 [Planctomycetota bacterium]